MSGSGDEWLTITDDHGRRRLDNPDDFVRLGVQAASPRNVRVIPVLVDRAKMPHADELPPPLASLVRRQALEFSPAPFEFDTNWLFKVLDHTLAEVRSTHYDGGMSPAAGSPAIRTHLHSERPVSGIDADASPVTSGDGIQVSGLQAGSRPDPDATRVGDTVTVTYALTGMKTPVHLYTDAGRHRIEWT